MEEYGFELPSKQTPEAPPNQGFDFKLPPSPVSVMPEQAKMEEDPESYWDWASLEGARTFFEAASLFITLFTTKSKSPSLSKSP